MARARKLFPSYGGALAMNLLAKIERDRIVHQFVRNYVADYNRRGILGAATRDSELGETIGREAVLATIYHFHQMLPRFFGKRRASALTEDEQEISDAFFREMMETLGRALHWTPEDKRHFSRDLALYSDFALRQAAARKTRQRGKVREEEPPFVGRVALLLDPSMLEQARRVARKFYVEMEGLAKKLLSQTLRRRS